MISANKLNFKVISTGSEAALIDVLTKAEENKTPAIAYFYEPQTFFVKMPGLKTSRVNFPANDWSDAGKASGLTDYPETILMKLATKRLMDSGSIFATIVKNFNWTNDDQNAVAYDIAVNKMIGTSLPAARILPTISRPSIPGSLRSSITRSQDSASARPAPSMPSSTSTTSMPSSTRALVIIGPRRRSSSTQSTLMRKL